MATHTLWEAEAICHRVAIIRHGKIVVAGSMEELSARMALAPALELVVAGTADGLRDVICTVPGIQDVAVLVEGGRARLTVQLGAQDGALDRVLRAVLNAGAQVESCTTRRPTLDDIYRAAHAQD